MLPVRNINGATSAKVVLGLSVLLVDAGLVSRAAIDLTVRSLSDNFGRTR